MKGFCIVNLNHSLIAKPLTLFPQWESQLDGIGELAFKICSVLLSFAILFYCKGKTTLSFTKEKHLPQKTKLLRQEEGNLLSKLHN